MSALPADARVGTVRLQVADLDRSLAFYRDLIGFREIGRQAGTATLGPHRRADGEASSTEAVLLELVEKPGVKPVPRTGLLGIYHFALLLPSRQDLGRFVRHHAQHGTSFGAADHAFSEALYLEDPDGITIEVYADRPRDRWPTRPDGDLPLVSDPLDAAGLMAAAGEGEWAGVPTGSVVGHMHFFVDDLDAADRFYVDGLGFETMIQIPTALFAAAGGYHHHVGLNTWRAGVRAATEDDARLLDWELILPDADAIEDAAGRLESQGAAIDRANGSVRARDPWGIEVRLTS